MCNRAVCHKSQSASLLSELIMYFTTLPAPSSSAFGFWPFWRTFEAKPKSSSWHTPQRWKENGNTENEWKDPLDVHPAIQSRTLSSHGQRTQMPRNSTRTQRSETGHQERVNTWGGFYKLEHPLKDAESAGLFGEELHFQYSKITKNELFPYFSYDRFVLRFSRNEAVSVSWRLTASLSLSDFKILRISPYMWLLWGKNSKNTVFIGRNDNNTGGERFQTEKPPFWTLLGAWFSPFPMWRIRARRAFSLYIPIRFSRPIYILCKSYTKRI